MTLVDTGLNTNTGGRIKKIESYVDGDIFSATYADGVADVDLRELVLFHKRHKKIVTVLAVNPLLQFGILSIDSRNLVTKFVEKPRLDVWVNGGFFIFNREVFRYLDENSVLEKAPFETLASKGEMAVYKHTGFWSCMDSYKDFVILNDMSNSGKAMWKVWE